MRKLRLRKLRTRKLRLRKLRTRKLRLKKIEAHFLRTRKLRTGPMGVLCLYQCIHRMRVPSVGYFRLSMVSRMVSL